MTSEERQSSVPQIQKLLTEEGALQQNDGQNDVHDSGRDSPLTSYPCTLSLSEIDSLAGNLDKEDEVTKTQILKAIVLVLQLTTSYEATDLLFCIRKLQKLLQYATEGLMRFFQNNQIQLPVIAAMKHMPAIAAIQQNGCQFLCLCAEKSQVLYDGLVQCNFTKDLIRVINENITDPVIQHAGMKMFARLLRSESVLEQLKQVGEGSEVLLLITVAIPAFRDDTEIQIAAAEALAILLASDEEIQDQFISKSMLIILEVLKASEDLMVQVPLLRVFYIILQNDRSLDTLIHYDLHLYLMDLCKSSSGEISLFSTILAILAQMCKKGDVPEVASSGFVEHIVAVLGQHKTHESIQCSGLNIISAGGPHLFAADTDESFLSRIVHLVFTAMFTHLDSPQVQIAGCRTVAVMLENVPDAHKCIGENPILKEEPVHNLCLGSILMFKRNKDVFISASEAIYWIAADNDRLSSVLMAKNAHYAIIEGLKRFRGDCLAVEAGCRALRGLCIFNDLHKNAIVMDDTFGLLVDVLKRHREIAAVQTEAISAIACLADIDLVRYQCYVQNVPDNILNAMKRFPDDETLQEACLEALAVLVAAEEGADILVSYGVGPCVLRALKTFESNIYVVKKGLILLQLLACKALLTKTEFCKDIARIIYKAIACFRDHHSLQTEAFVAIQLLAETDTHMSELFVEEGCHEFLFEAINDSEKGSDLNDVAGECFFVLCQEQDQKSKMLLSACKKNAVDVVECLVEMNSDVNVEEDGMTPLFHAVCCGQADIVTVLLRHDVRELNAPLKKSLELENDITTGLLLRQIGYDRESCNITWSSLGLEEVRVEWILASITSSLTTEQETEPEKPYLMKLKTSEQKRQKRKLEYSKSDPTARRTRLRHVSSKTSTGSTSDVDESFGVPQTAAVTTNEPPIQFKVKRDPLKRSLSVDMSTPSSSPIWIRRQPTLPTIISGSSQSPVNDLPVFVISADEVGEYKKSTVTGANVPYNPKDPRQETHDVNKLETSDVDVPWQRKRPRTPKDNQLISSSSLSSDDFTSNSRWGRRKLSAPTLSTVSSGQSPKLLFRRRKGSIDSITDTEESVLQLMNEKLLSFDISDNKITSIESLASPTLQIHFEKLERLDISANALKEIPESIFKNLPNLQNFDARCNQLEKFPVDALKCEKLTDLILSRNKIPEMQLHHFNVSIRKLDMSYNQLTYLPSGIGSYLHRLKELILNNNHLMAVPETPLGLKELKRLDISHNQIDCIPESFLHTCNKLETLEASFNYISQLPSEAVSAMLPKLTKVRLRKNALSTKPPYYMPKFILDLPSLRYLDVSENSLTGFPAIPLWESTLVKELLLNKNMITTLNLEGAKTWNKLEKLHISENCLRELPGEIGNFTSLSSLDISYNYGITTLPDGLGKCSKMWELQLDGLDLDLDRTLMQRRVKDIICYLHNKLKKSKRYYRMKLMVVGYGGRGKTTLLKSLMQRNRKSKKLKLKENRPTVGIDVREWKYKRYERRFSDDIDKSWTSGGRTVEYTLSTWDFAGQEDFYGTHQCYLSNRTIYLVVFDFRRGVSDLMMLKIWLASIHSRAPGCQVIVVGTHKDRVSQGEEKTKEEVKKLTEKIQEYRTMPGFPSIHGVFLVDATCENEDMEYLRNTIKNFVEEYRFRGKRVMGEKIPASYVQLSDLLAEEANNLQDSYPVIRHGRLLQIVRKANLDLDEDELQQAIHYLHESGVLLHYTDSTLQLRDFYFIDPGWLCRMMAQVVTVKQINPFISKEGILRKKDVPFLFRGKAAFPEDLIPQYLKLLEKFEIALPHSEEELLIPCRLSEERPAGIDLPRNANGKIVRLYKMPYVPIGLWFRLISRMITLTDNKAFHALLGIAEPRISKCWRRGLYLYWCQENYLLLEPVANATEDTEGIKIVVPCTRYGSRLLGQIVDNIDNLIDEWYPGLTSIDPILGHRVLEVEIPCTKCPDFDVGFDKCHRFLLKDIQDVLEEKDVILCPKHGGDVAIAELAPDLIMNDLEPNFKLNLEDFEFEESSDKQLGDGGFGDVYTGIYKGKEVAVKVFKKIAEMHSLTMMRQEATILRCLNHLSIVSLVAVGIRPTVIVLELAPLGTLGHLVKKETLGGSSWKVLKQRIALQVAEGLMYLHKMMIVFRDMKPDNVLIFSLSPKAWVHAKISDYGIARFSAYEGLKAQEGTLAYRAPEVIRKENYSYKADVFSYGLTMYMMLAKRHPFDQLETKGEMDRAIAEGLTVPPLEGKNIPEWPDMHVLIMQCLNHDPSLRPTTDKIVEILQSPEMLSLRKMVYVSKSTTVECFATEIDKEKRQISLWIASGDSSTYQLCKFSLSDPGARSTGRNFGHGRIMCMQALPPYYLALGTQLGRVWLYDTQSNELKHASAQLQDSVLCMKYIIRHNENNLEENGMLLVGLANGKIAVFPLSEFFQEENVDPICLYPGEEYEPVLCMARNSKQVFVSCGAQIITLNSIRGISIEKITAIDKNRSRASAPIYNLSASRKTVFFSRMNSPEVEMLDTVKDQVRDLFSMDTMFGLPKTEARVTALACTPKSTIWVGTHCGHIALVDYTKLEPITITQRYVRSVRCLTYVKDFRFPREQVLLSGGLGFRELPGQDVDKGSLCGCVAIWNPNMANEARSSAEYEKKRKEFKEKKHVTGANTT